MNIQIIRTGNRGLFTTFMTVRRIRVLRRGCQTHAHTS